MTLQFRRGSAAIQDAAKSGGGGSFHPFVPRIDWREDGESKYILVLTPLDETVTVLFHDWIPVKEVEKANGETYTVWDAFVSRKDQVIGEKYDDLEDRLERDPKMRTLGVMVELEPIVKNIDGRDRVKGFVAKTDTYTRKDEDGDEVEVTQPVMGICVGSPRTVWGTIDTTNMSQGPMIDVPVEVIRRGKDQNTRYDVVPFLDIPVDLSPVINHVDGLSYLGEELEDILAACESVGSEVEAAQEIASAMFDKRLDELIDGERYEELVGPLHLEDMPKQFGASKKGKGKGKKRAPRPTRTTRREAVKEEPAAEAEAPAEAPAEKEKPNKEDRFAALKARVEEGK